jgi:50S ribosomal subunit-associated GTPase HflX
MEYVGKGKVATIVEKYDQQVLMFLLVVVSKHLNPRNVENLPPSTTIVDDSGLL